MTSTAQRNWATGASDDVAASLFEGAKHVFTTDEVRAFYEQQLGI